MTIPSDILQIPIPLNQRFHHHPYGLPFCFHRHLRHSHPVREWVQLPFLHLHWERWSALRILHHGPHRPELRQRQLPLHFSVAKVEKECFNAIQNEKHGNK